MKMKVISAASVAAMGSMGFVPLGWGAEVQDEALEDVVVTATLTARPKASTPAFTTILTEKDIAKAPVNSLPDLLRETVGVNNVTDANGRDEIQIRGLDGRYTLILVDGKRVSSSGALWRGSDFDLSTIPLAGIERVEIVRGPMSALYGSDAMGGVINIITKRPTKEWHGEVTGEYRVIGAGDEGTQRKVGASLSGALSDQVTLSMAGEAYDRDAWFTHSASDPTESPALEGKKSRNFTSTLAVQLTPEQSLDVDLGYNYDKRPWGLNNYVYYPAYDYESYSYSTQDIERLSLGLTHKGTWSWGKTVAFLKHEHSDIYDYDTDYNSPQKRNYKELNTYAKAYGVSKLGEHTVTAGVDYRRQDIEDAATYLQSGEVSTDQFAVFGQDELGLGDAWLLTVGGRVDHHDTFGNHFSPKVYLNYFLADGVTIKGGVSRAFKAPDAYQMSKEYSIISCGGSCYLSGNPDLTPETSTSYEIGVELTKPGWHASAVFFHNDVKDMIVAVYDSSVPSREWTNIAKAKTSGIELEGAIDLTSTVSLNGNLTIQKADYTDQTGATTKLENRPDQKAMLGVNWKAMENFTAGLSVNYIGNQYYEDEELPAYTRFDLTTATRVGKALTLRAGIKNVTDVNLKDKNDNFLSNELGRNYYVSMSYAF